MGFRVLSLLEMSASVGGREPFEVPVQSWDLNLTTSASPPRGEAEALLLAALSGLSVFLMTSADSPDIYFLPFTQTTTR